MAAAGSPDFPRFRLATPSVPGGARYSVFLPPTYAGGGGPYPVLYFLHDAFGDDRVLWRNGVIARIDSAMRAGNLPEFLVVCPDGDGSWFSNSHDGRRRYEDLVTIDLPREIDGRFRTLPGTSARGITGISMGGYGSVKIALHHPGDYGSVSGLSAAVIPMQWKAVELLSFFARRQIHRVFGSSPSDNSLAENDVWQLLAARRRWDVPFEVFLLGGTEDKYGLGGAGAQYADFLNRHGIRATARLEPGVHDWPYWREAMMEIARWHGARFASARNAGRVENRNTAIAAIERR
jgi:S-formylglutathione hydrolase FrmB